MDLLSSQSAEAIVRAIESATQVKRRYQFFVWSQSYLQILTPHQIALCAAYQRTRRDLVVEAFHSIAIPPSVLATLTDAGSVLMQQVIGRWVEHRGRAMTIELASLGGSAAGTERDRLMQLGFEELLVHGVSRPQRPAEIESFFVFSAPKQRHSAQQLMVFELLMPHLHSTYLRVQATEREVLGNPSLPGAPRRSSSGDLITQREKQILGWVREGKSNMEIGQQLEISALTVKNHIQKILRKLGAANRAQAVAKAMTLNLLASSPDDDAPAPRKAA